MKSDRRMLASVPEGGLSGPNDDHYSLKALAAKAEPTVSATQAAATVDDSGLIDLKKLMANAEAIENMPPVLSPLEAYPFGAPEVTPLPQAFEAAKPAEASKRGKNLKWLVTSFVLVTSAIVTVGVLQMRAARNAQGPDSSRIGQAAVVVDVAPSRPVEAIAAPQNTPAPKENTAAAAANNPAPAVAPRAQRLATDGPQRQRAQQKAPVAKSKTVEAPAPPPPPAEPCDLKCEIDKRMKKK